MSRDIELNQIFSDRSPVLMSSFIGQKLQTVWVCENQQGYRDRVSFVFNTLRPSLEFVCEGSAIAVF